MTTSITLRGYISHVDEKTITLDGCDPFVWKKLPVSYFAKNIRRRVSKDFKTCTIRITKSTTCTKGPQKKQVPINEMQSCYVDVAASIKKYRLRKEGVQWVEGWVVNALSIKTARAPPTPPPVRGVI